MSGLSDVEREVAELESIVRGAEGVEMPPLVYLECLERTGALYKDFAEAVQGTMAAAGGNGEVDPGELIEDLHRRINAISAEMDGRGTKASGITADSMQCSSSRTLPGQSWACSAAREEGLGKTASGKEALGNGASGKKASGTLEAETGVGYSGMARTARFLMGTVMVGGGGYVVLENMRVAAPWGSSTPDLGGVYSHIREMSILSLLILIVLFVGGFKLLFSSLKDRSQQSGGLT